MSGNFKQKTHLSLSKKDFLSIARAERVASRGNPTKQNKTKSNVKLQY